jgi:hypothetical protein
MLAGFLNTATSLVAYPKGSEAHNTDRSTLANKTTTNTTHKAHV